MVGDSRQGKVKTRTLKTAGMRHVQAWSVTLPPGEGHEPSTSGTHMLSVKYATMHPLHWVYANRDFLQALSGLAIVALTLVLLLLNIIYVRANWKTMQLMENDLRFRIKPMPKFEMSICQKDAFLEYQLSISTFNAPLRFQTLWLRFPQRDRRHTHKVFVQVQNRVLRLEETYAFKGEFAPGAKTDEWLADLTYQDMAGLYTYQYSFESSDPHLGYEKIVVGVPGPPGLWGRLKTRLIHPRKVTPQS